MRALIAVLLLTACASEPEHIATDAELHVKVLCADDWDAFVRGRVACDAPCESLYSRERPRGGCVLTEPSPDPAYFKSCGEFESVLYMGRIGCCADNQTIPGEIQFYRCDEFVP
jgi:hypothetical protein